MEKKRKKLTNREWWEKHREQFERTERHYEEAKVRWARRAEARAAREAAAADGETA